MANDVLRANDNDGGTEFVEEVIGRSDRWGGLAASNLIESEIVSGLVRKHRQPQPNLPVAEPLGKLD
jgi:hypothetical protein